VSLRSALSFGLVLALFAFARPAASADPQPPATQGDKPVVVVLDTSQGQIEIELDAVKAPISTENFLAYVDAGHYDGTVFHRVIPNFMVQGGGFDQSMKQKPTRGPIKNEADNGLVNARGTVAMARTSDVNSATSQFFINVVDNGFLNHGSRDFGYAVFGKVTKGMDIADKIAATKTGAQDVPVEPIVIKKASRKP
jgi:peptidyl-prolyl cis-trans isomerase A (cyclophilin A)